MLLNTYIVNRISYINENMDNKEKKCIKIFCHVIYIVIPLLSNTSRFNGATSVLNRSNALHAAVYTNDDKYYELDFQLRLEDFPINFGHYIFAAC